MAITNADRALFAQKVVQDYFSKITGEEENRVVGALPDKAFLVGKLYPVQDKQENTSSSATYIESIGIDFRISKSDANDAKITLIPTGDLFYRSLPTIEEQRAAYLDEFSKVNSDLAVHSFQDLVELYSDNQSPFDNVKVKLIPVYKKISLKDENIVLEFNSNDLVEAGYVGEDGKINLTLSEALNDIQTKVKNDPEWMSESNKEPTVMKNLLSDQDYNLFLQQSKSTKVVSQGQNWKLYFDISVTEHDDEYIISVSYINNSRGFNGKNERSKNDDKFAVDTLFNAGFKVILKNASFIPITLDSFKDDYKYNTAQYALGNNCSVKYDEKENSVSTENIPIFPQYRLKTNNHPEATFEDLIDKPVDTLNNIAHAMHIELQNWKFEEQNRIAQGKLNSAAKTQMENEIDGFEDEIRRFEFGIRVIDEHQIVRQSFVQMNTAFKATAKGYHSWRLFQIVFIVSIIPDIVACDKNVMQDDHERAKTTLSDMSLLYFPTGGGKTEAFLGALIFNLFFDRHRGKWAGVTSFLRYPLRLLSVQQVQRLANVLAQAELIRRSDDEIKGTFPFSLGYFVGDNATPNRLKSTDYDHYDSISQSQRDESRVIDICPFCGKKTIHIRTDRDRCRLIHYCDNPDCPSGGDLELYIVDEEIYRYLPSAIISTVDKLSIMGVNANFRNILNGADMYCPKHGFTSKDKCIEKSCKVEVQNFKHVDMYDPAPTLFIQDELHLIRESLGTFASHYESFMRYYIQNVSKSHRDIKVIGATATISSYQEQVYHLYMKNPIKFPCTSIYLDHDFYSKIDYTDLQRIILGYASFGKSVLDTMVFSMEHMREVIDRYYKHPDYVLRIPKIGVKTQGEARKLIEDYWIFLEYNNVKRDGNNVEGALESPVNIQLEKENIAPFNTRKMTGDESFQDVREVLAQVENTSDVYNGLNMIIATSMISHGVDADRFNIMYFYGIPGNMAEYIQAYSRTGRRYPSIVIDIIRPARETDMSFLRNFIQMHEYKDLLVESVPINRWATKAIESTIGGIFTSLLLTKYDISAQYTVGSLFFMNNIQKAISSGILNKDQIKKELYQAYGCEDNVGNPESLGNQYKILISNYVDNIFTQITTNMWDGTIIDGFKSMGYKVMNSLRNTDSDMVIEMEG